MARIRKINAGNEALSGAFLYAAGAACGASGAALIGQSPIDGATVGLTISTAIFLKWQITGRGWRFKQSRKVKTHPRQFANALPWYVQEDAQTERIIKWYDRREKPPEEFVFFGLDLPTKIPEHMMYRFCRLALHRQAIVFDTERKTYKRNGRKLRAHEILSKMYFTRRLSPRFLPEQYEAIKEVLELTGLWVDSRAGHPGFLMVAHGTTPQKMVHTARWGWIDIIVRTDNVQSQPFWKRTPSPLTFKTKQ